MSKEYRVIKGPVITEKASRGMEGAGQYVFEVDSRANKIQIRKAVESAFKVGVVKVNTMWMRGKLKRIRWQIGSTSDWKKAVVTLKKGQKIEYVK
jgi:large subunit ribosomal protein L23